MIIDILSEIKYEIVLYFIFVGFYINVLLLFVYGYLGILIVFYYNICLSFLLY